MQWFLTTDIHLHSSKAHWLEVGCNESATQPSDQSHPINQEIENSVETDLEWFFGFWYFLELLCIKANKANNKFLNYCD